MEGGILRGCTAVLVTALLPAMLTVPAAGAHPSPRAAEEDIDRPPLAVSIETLTPSTVPQRGRVTVTGEITNRSESSWTDLNVYFFASAEPMTTSAELEAATATDSATQVGDRLTGSGLYDEVADLEPGQSTRYRLSIPRTELPFASPGVYWVGVHVLGTSEEGRVEGADGRARTFMASMPGRAPQTTLALVVPVRAPVRRTPEGRLAGMEGWARRTGEDGRLTRLVELVDTADERLTLVVDPAVLDAVRSVADGNPGFDLTPTDGSASGRPSGAPSSDGGASDGGSPDGPSPDSPLTESPGAGGTDEGGTEDPGEELTEVSTEARAAGEWLTGFTGTAADHSLLALPYGDVDVATMLRGEFADALDQADRLGNRVTADLGLDADPVVAPPDGLLPTSTLERIDPETTVLLSERAVDTDATKISVGRGPAAVLASDIARIGGPGPTSPFDALALRQRILAESAVHGLSEDSDRPLVVSTPDLWNPGRDWRSAAFFDGLDVSWIRTVDLAFAAALSTTEEHDDGLAYDANNRRREVPVANVLATQELSAAGSVLAELLTRNDSIDAQVGGAAMLGSSVHARANPDRARAMTRGMSQEVHARLTEVYVEGSPLVTMSSGSGNFQVTVVNGLDEPVTVGIKADTGTEELVIRAPDLVSLGAGQRASVRLAATATDIGVHSVRIIPTTRSGEPLGRTTKIKVRSSQVGLVIWLIMGTGAVVFVVTIAARVLRRIRERKRTFGPRLEGRG